MQPELAKEFELLRSVITLSKKALEKIRIAKKIRSSLEARIAICTESDSVKSTLIKLASPLETNKDLEFSLSNYFIVSEATVQDGGEIEVHSHEDSSQGEETGVIKWSGEEATVQVVAVPVSVETGHQKCLRCWKWTCPEKEDLCERCKQVERKDSNV